MIIVMPLILLQIVSALIFFETHWDKVTLRLARSVAGDIAVIMDVLRQDRSVEGQQKIFKIAAENMHITATLIPQAMIKQETKNTIRITDGLMERMLRKALKEYVRKPFKIDTASLKRQVKIDVQLSDAVLRIITTRKRLFSSTVYVFVIWMIGTSMILFGVATIFMRNQVRPIRRLAIAADQFGKGREVIKFKPEGATEVRQAATAFMVMRDRIKRQISQRTDMLAGVSHDLRTPLTRMKLQLAMLNKDIGAEELQTDIVEMEHMLEGYLAFARGEGGEKTSFSDISQILSGVVADTRRKGALIDLHSEGQLMITLRPGAFKRCLMNIIENALHYADHVMIRAGRRQDCIEIVIDDDGPGIAEMDREDVFKPFYRLEKSRNQYTGGVGLGLSIARDVMRALGGEIALETSPDDGLRVRLRIPI